MTDFDKLKQEIAVQYPDFTDKELFETTSDLIRFYTVATKSFLKLEAANDNLMSPEATSPELKTVENSTLAASF